VTTDPIQIDHRNEYIPRVIDDRIVHLLSVFGAILITGPKWCGKSWTGKQHSKSSIAVDENRILVAMNPKSALIGDTPRLIDEWQDVPELWDAARREIDNRSLPGQYIFTGSAVPPKTLTSHSGTGRFARVNMRPMSLFESGDSNGTISLSGLFNGDIVEFQNSSINYQTAVRLICRGGWPFAIRMDYDDAISIPEEYIEDVVNSDLQFISGKKRNSSLMRLMLRSLARNTATSAKASVIAADISRDGAEISEQSVREYINDLKSIFVIDEQEAWHPQLRSRIRIRSSPKRHFIDPSLAVASMGIGAESIISDPNTAGFLFESLCYRDLCIYSSALGGHVYHYRDSTDLEVDCIVELRDGRWGAIEVKMGNIEIDKAAGNLLALKNKMNDGSPPPSFLMVLCATSKAAYTRKDGIFVVPIDCFGP
jgi:predicted AAA+ superfamily ATPase